MSHHALVETAALAAVLLALVPSRALAHCDTMNGPVVKDAQAAHTTSVTHAGHEAPHAGGHQH